MNYSLLQWLILSVLVASTDVRAGDVWVNNQVGDDAGMGSRVEPFRTVAHALQRIRPGMTLHLIPTPVPYQAGIRVEISGTSDAPIIVDGHGSIVSGRQHLPAAKWQEEGGGVFSRPLPNNAWGMERQWEGGFPLVWFDGRAGLNVPSRTALRPYGFFLHKNRKQQDTDPLHNWLFIQLPPGKTPDDVFVESINQLGGVYVGGNHVIVKNIVCEYGGRDGFATHRNCGVVFEHVEARYFMDQGMSHHGADVTVRNAHFHHNAGGGIVDVYPEARVRYEGCLIEADTWRGGVEFHSGTFAMTDCLIRGNQKKALTVTKGARVDLHNCLLIAPEFGITTGIILTGDNSQLKMTRCTLYGFSVGLDARITATNHLTVRRCAWLQCQVNTRIHGIQRAEDPALEVDKHLQLSRNLYEPSLWETGWRWQDDDGKWKVEQQTFTAGEQEGFAARIGSDSDALTTQINCSDPMTIPPLRTARGDPLGARIPETLHFGPLPPK